MTKITHIWSIQEWYTFSFSSEYGTIYYKDELVSLHNVCKEYQIPLYIDGARLGYGISAEDSDLNLKDIAENCMMSFILEEPRLELYVVKQ